MVYPMCLCFYIIRVNKNIGIYVHVYIRVYREVGIGIQGFYKI